MEALPVAGKYGGARNVAAVGPGFLAIKAV